MSVDPDDDPREATPCNYPHASNEGRLKIVPADEVGRHVLRARLCPCLKDHDEHPVMSVADLGTHRDYVVLHKTTGCLHQCEVER